MMKKVIYIAVLIFVLFSCKKEDNNSTLVGKLENIEDGTYLYLRDFYTYELIDSIQVESGTFSYNFVSDSSKPYILHNKRNQYGFRDRKLIWLESKDIKISGNCEFLHGLKIEGSTLQNMQVECDKNFNYFGRKIDSLYQVVLSGGDEKVIEKEKNLIKHQLVNQISKYSSFFIDSYFTILLLYPPEYFQQNQIKDKDILNVYDSLPEKLKNIESRKKFGKSIMLPWIPESRVAHNIIQQTPNGDTVKLSDLKGKYVLIDFWASWCVPCRKSFVELKGVYAKYKSKGFEVYSVSWDDDNKAWTDAIDNDSIPWINVSDLKGKQNKAFLDYNVSGVPTQFLIDKSGIIILRGYFDINLLDTELQEIFGKDK